MVDAGNDGADKVGTEAAFVESTRHEVGHCLRRDLALFAETVHVDLVAEEFADRRHIGGKASETEVDVAVGEDFGKVVGYCQGLETES